MIFLDNASTTPIDQDIQKSYFELINKYYANASSSHKLGVIVDSLQNRARTQIAQLFCCEPRNVIFTAGASEANNLTIKGVAFQYQNRGKHIITSSIEHKSVLETCRQLQDLFGFSITYLNPNEQGIITLAMVQQALRPDTILVSIMTVNNELGSINDIEAIAKYLKKETKVFFHSDASQAIGKIEANYSEVDLLTVSAHKIYGFKGSGMLIKRSRVNLVPLICGGGQEFGLRSGTANWPLNVILAKTLRLAFAGQKENYDRVKQYHDMIIKHLSTQPLCQINSPLNGSPYIINFSLKGKMASTIAQAFETYEIYISTISACSTHEAAPSYVVEQTFNDLNRAKSSVRVGLSKNTTLAEINEFLHAFDEIAKYLRDGE